MKSFFKLFNQPYVAKKTGHIAFKKLVAFKPFVTTISFMLFISVLITLSGCRDNSQENDVVSKQEETESVINNEDTVLSTNSEKIDNETITNISNIKGSNFSDDGLAWITYCDSSNTDEIKAGIMETNGEVTPVDLSNYDVVEKSDFLGGYSYVNYTTDNDLNGYAIINEVGEIVAQSPKEENYKIVCGGNGYYLTCHMVRSMTVAADLYGIINQDGTYVCEEKENFLFPDKCGDDWLREHGKVEYSYLGNCFFQSNWKQSSSFTDVPKKVVFNAKEEDESKKFELVAIDYEGESSEDGFEYIDSLKAEVEGIYNDNIIWSSTSTNKVYCNDKEIISFDDVYSPYIKYYDETIFIGSNPPNPGNRISDGKFYDLSGNVVLDVSEYQMYVLDGCYTFVDGYTYLYIAGADGLAYLMIVDKTGKSECEPIQTSGFLGNSLLRYGKYAICMIYYKDENGFKTSMIDPSGKMTVCEFLKGCSSSSKIINDVVYNGNTYYSMDGKIIAPHLKK
jgi:hypothetical protein